MLPFRKFGYHSSACPSSGLLQLLVVWHYKVANVASYGTSTHLNHRFARKFMGFLSTKEMLMAVKYETCPFRTHFSTMDGSILVQARDPSQVALELETAVEEQRFGDAWKAYEKHINMDGFPRKSVLSKLITALAESCDRHWLDKAYTIVDLVFKEKKHELLEKEPLIYLSFILARCEMPVYASNIVRKLIQMEAFPPTAAWSAVIGHMSQTTTGAFLASELIMEIGYLFKDNRVDPRKKSNRPLLSMKPTSFVFNIALTGCLLFGTTRKAEQLLELMPRVGVKPDANLLIVMARIYEKNGHRDEIKKLKRHVDEACGLGDFEFQQFYDCLLSCHLKFGDLGSAVDMVLDMLRKAKEAKRSLDAAKLVLKAVETGKTFLPYQNSGHGKLDNMDSSCLIKACAPSYVDFTKDRNFLRLEAEATESLKLLSGKLQSQVELVMSEHGILYPTEKMYAKLVKAFLDADKINDLAAFLIKASKEDFPVSVENSTVVQVINACIALGLLDQAHDLLDEMRFSGIRVSSSVYSSLLKAYCKENRHGEIMSLFRDAQKAGIQLDSSCYEALIQSRVHHNDPREALHLFKEMKESNISRSSHCASDMLVEGSVRSGEAGLMDKLLEEIKNNQRVDYEVHDWNNVIHFFCKRRMMHDAQKSLNKMRALGHTPNAQTFHSLVTAYAAIGGKYVEVTDIWGEMKVLSSSSSMKFDQELLDSLLYCFVRGGFFLRAMEVIGMMENGRMFIDKYKYRSLWLKYHRTLYKGKAPKIQTEAQLKRREAALAFKRWIGLT
uniref:Pentatricopeptide repeat-containing protein At1g03100, mitochondrial n=1 Tax=Elaeis guineensis var. tenera TaxID=51953 RepID=A0A6I9RUY5_ELAGV|nr:pentatricopeptide repeat-containing protein At1g03100, mitochondrial [Elaeis guineensis]XP_010932782.1 pentatricopeptide repeat-containing protein At1g03100, mitochondrial [Elaeis guineensis]XP_029122907.1 pentatricopeptide repeat-containing protein At1g03100, mitochondrial [Elaeis guineensis]XP_029122908.1 pentatricopeptide repeat-containing protein At1g03100, mitochondrial [Elaeis guineensis]